MSEEQRAVIDDSNLDQVWGAVANCVKKITGDVDPSTDGTLQAQINKLKESGGGGTTTGVDARLGQDITNVIYQLSITGAIDTSELQLVSVYDIASADSVNILHGTYNDGKVEI
ncbi:MAG: hypothetical protein ACI4F1_04505 [Bariatricus sp.]